MKIKKLFLNFCLSATFIVFIGVSSKAQNSGGSGSPTYKTAIGAKFTPFAVTFKTFIGRKNRALELLGDFDDGFRLTALYEIHGNLTAPGNLKWYIGFGAHGGFYNPEPNDGPMFGIDAVGGLDYKFSRLPINLSLDWQPAYEFISPQAEFQGGRGGLAVRFAF